MKEVSIIVHDDYLENLVEGLHESGLIEMMDVGKSQKDLSELLSSSSASKMASEFADLEMQINKLIDILGKAKGEQSGGMGQDIKGFLSPTIPKKIEVIPKTSSKTRDGAEALLFDLEPKITMIERKLEEISDELASLEDHKKQISTMATFDFPLEYLGQSEYLIIKAGTTSDLDRFRTAMKKVPDALIFSTPVDKTQFCVVVVAHVDEKEALDNAQKGVFSPFTFPKYEGKPRAALDEIKNRTKELHDSQKAILKDLANLKKNHLKELRILKEEIGIHKARGEALAKFGKTESTSLVMGWAPTKNLKKLESLIESETEGYAFISTSDPEGSEDIPIYRKNPRWARPFEMLTEMFALPYYHEVDPTIILAPIFVLFFGLMLGDAVYGALVLLAGLLIYKGQGKVSKSMHDMGIILSCIGFSGVIFGIVQGSYAGPLTVDNPLTPLLFNGEIDGTVFSGIGANHAILLDSMNNPIPLLVLALIIGLIHLNMGLLLAVWQNARQKAYQDILLSQVSWFFLQFAGIVVFGAFFGWFTFPMYIKIPAYICGISGLAMVFLQHGEEDADGKRKRKGPLAFFDITGYIGNWLSYARILALGLATAGIAMTVNIIAMLIKSIMEGIPQMICAGMFVLGIALFAVGYSKKKPAFTGISILFLLIGIFGAVGAIQVSVALILLLIFIFGHIANAVLQALGGFIHALRLHYVEFFGQFYTGGGRKFSPFVTEREFTTVKGTDKTKAEVRK
jgi:V/A-type H+-transporting ATPase subunit I